MGPLFSLLALAFPVSVAFCLMAGLARLFLPTRPALVAAGLMTVAGGVGGFASMIIETLVVGDTLTSRGQILGFFLIGLIVALASAAVTLWAFVRWRSSRTRRAAAEQFS